MLGEILTFSGVKSKVGGMLPAMILFALVKMFEFLADETPANMGGKVIQHTKRINTAKAL